MTPASKKRLATALLGPPLAAALALLWIVRDVQAPGREAAALDRYLPAWDQDEALSIDVAAPPDAAWAAVRETGLVDVAPLRAALAVRSGVAHLLGRKGPPTAPGRAHRRWTVDDLVREELFLLLEESPGREIVLGGVRRPWREDLGGDPPRPAPPAFAAFAEPGWAKVAWSIAVRPREAGSRIVVAWRTATTDGASAAAFRGYWRIAGPAVRLCARLALPGLRDLAEARARPPAALAPGRPRR